MKRYFVFILLSLLAVSMWAQNRQGVFVYRKNGDIEVHYAKNVDSIYFSPVDLEGESHPNMVTTIIKEKGGLYRIPVADIDSIGFTHPNPQQMRREGKLNPITSEAFRALVWDYKKNPGQLVFEGERPVVVDYWAKWCRYCIQMMPLVQQLAQEYKGRVDFYKIDTDEEPEVSNVMGMTSLPCFYFYPKKGQPEIRLGSMDLASMRDIIDRVLLATDDENPDAAKPEVAVDAWKGDEFHEWTNRKVSAQIRCTSGNAAMVKYGFFLKEDVEYGGLTEKEVVQRQGQVLEEAALEKVNGPEGVTVTFPAKKDAAYVFLCLVKTAQGGVVVERSEVKTDATYTPALEFQVERGAIIDYLQDGRPLHASLYFKSLDAVEMSYACLLKTDVDAAFKAGENRVTLLQKYGQSLDAAAVKAANATGHAVVVSGLQEMTDYICIAMMRDAAGKISTAQMDLTTPYNGYPEEIGYPDVLQITGYSGGAVSSSMNCRSGDAIYGAELLLPSEEVARLLAEGATLESLMESHSDVNVFGAQQLEWVNGAGISYVRPDLPAESRYTWIVDVRGRFGGRVVQRVELLTLKKGAEAPVLNLFFNAGYERGMMTISATCQSGNASSAKLALLENSKLEQLLASGKTLESLMDQPTDDFIRCEDFSKDQLQWLNTNGMVTGHVEEKPNTRYTWILDVRSAAGDRVVKRADVLTPKKW